MTYCEKVIFKTGISPNILEKCLEGRKQAIKDTFSQTKKNVASKLTQNFPNLKSPWVKCFLKDEKLYKSCPNTDFKIISGHKNSSSANIPHSLTYQCNKQR